MAAIEQIIQIAANERVADAANTLAGTANTTANTANATANTANATATAAQTTANGAIQHTAFTVSQAAINSGYITVAGSGNSTTYTLSAPAAVNLSDVRSFTNATARNAFNNSAGWHTGDIAILTESEQRAGELSFSDTPFTYSAFVSSTSFRSNGAWDNANNRPAANLGFGTGDTIRFRLFGDTRIAGSTQGGTDFTVQTIAQQSPGSSNAIITIDRSTLPADSQPPVDTGSTILAGTMTPGANIVSGTYLYTGATSGENETGVTVDADWTLLTVPAGTASNSDLATFSLNGAAASTLGAIAYNSTADTLTINGQSIELATTPVTFGRNFYQYTGADLVITGLGPTGTGDQEFTVTIPSNWTHRRGPAGATLPATWDASASLFGNGMKLSYGPAANGNDWLLDATGATITITVSQAQRRELGAGESRSLLLEMETIT